MNFQAVSAIYKFEMARFFRTLKQSFLSPVLSTSLYFVVFGTAIGSRMEAVDGVEYGAFIVPGLIMLSVMTQSITNASFGIYFPKFIGTIYELLSAPVNFLEIIFLILFVSGYAEILNVLIFFFKYLINLFSNLITLSFLSSLRNFSLSILSG